MSKKTEELGPTFCCNALESFVSGDVKFMNQRTGLYNVQRDRESLCLVIYLVMISEFLRCLVEIFTFVERLAECCSLVTRNFMFCTIVVRFPVTM